MNQMRTIRIEKITLNIGCGNKMKPEIAKNILEELSSCTAVITRAKKRSPFGVPKNKPIGSKVTVRYNTEDFLRKMLDAKDYKLQKSSFDTGGNFSFGIKEHIDVAGMNYDPSIGMLGFDICVTLERPGYRVKRKKLSHKVGKRHIITKVDAIEFVTKKFGVKIEE